MLCTANTTRWNRSLAATITKPSRMPRRRQQAQLFLMILRSCTPNIRHGATASTPSRTRLIISILSRQRMNLSPKNNGMRREKLKQGKCKNSR